MKYEQGSQFNNDGRQQFTSQPMDSQSARREQANSDRGCISVFEPKRINQQDGTWKRYSRTEEATENQRIISIAKENHLYIDFQDIANYGSLYSQETGESYVYANEKLGLVFKIRNPFAKRVLKDLHPCDIIYEHIVHNILFPSTRYNFVGITSEIDEVRIILSQNFCMAQEIPSDDEIADYLATLGLLPEGKYYFGNEYVAITDVSAMSDNVLKDADGKLYFIDPIIKMKKPAPLVIDWLLSDNCTMWQCTPIEKHESLTKKIANWIRRK